MIAGALMKPSEAQPWAVVGWDTFEAREYPVSRHSTETEAKEAGQRRLLELAEEQPPDASGGQDGIQDRVYITGPGGVRYQVR